MTMTSKPPTLIAALRAIPLFAGLTADILGQIAAEATTVHLSSGEWLFKKGDPGESAFVVVSGRLEVIGERSDPLGPHEREAGEVLRSIGRGSVIGEIALLQDSPRTASVRARRDSELLRVDRERFMELLLSEPSVAMALTRQLGTQLAEHRRLILDPPPTPVTLAMVALSDGIDLTPVARELAAALGTHGSVGYIDGDPGGGGMTRAEGAALIERLERDYDRMLLVSQAGPDDPWSTFCLRQADRVLAFADTRERPPALLPPVSQCDLGLVTHGASSAEIARWANAVLPRSVHPLPAGMMGPAIARWARQLAGRSVGLVLSGGGARGFAHIGAVDAVRNAGIEIDRIGGSSMGGYIGALFATGASVEQVAERCREEFVARNPLNDYTLPLVAFTRGRRGLAMLERSFGDLTIEELPIEFYCTASDLFENAIVEHRRGALVNAVGSSVAMPAFVPPVVSEGRILVDGGVLNNLPVQSMAMRGEGPVIAIDVTAPTRRPVLPGSRHRRSLGRRLGHRVHSWITGADVTPLGIADTITRCVVLGSADTAAAARRYADLVIAPALPDVEMLDYHLLDRAIEAGRNAAVITLEQAEPLGRQLVGDERELEVAVAP